MAKRKDMGRLKHYRRKGYASKRTARRALAAVAALAALFVAGWLVAPAVADLGTRAWYGLKDHFTGGGAPSPTPAPTPEETGVPQATPAPTAGPTPAGQIAAGDWAVVSLTSVGSPEAAQATARQLAEQGVRYAVLPLKDAQGYIYYDSKVELAAASIAGLKVDPAMVAQALRDAGLTPVASVFAFQDPVAAYADRSLCVQYGDGGVVWLDAAASAGGKPWLDVTSAGAQGYIESLLAEVRGFGFDQVLVSGVQFPSGLSLEKAVYAAGTAQQVDKAAQLQALLARWQAAADEGGWVLWVEVNAAEGALEESATLGALSRLGIRNLVLDAGGAAEGDEGQAQLSQAVQNGRAGGAEHIVVRTGGTARFSEG